MKKGSKYIAPSLCDKWDDITCVIEFLAADILLNSLHGQVSCLFFHSGWNCSNYTYIEL